MHSSPARLRELLERKGPLLVGGVPNALYARALQHCGFEALYATGAGIANMGWAFPDVGLLTQSEMRDEVLRITASVELPVIADADTGYGGPLNVYRTVAELEAGGVAGIQIEDQVAPKRCGHFDRHSVVPQDEMLERLSAAMEARRDPNLVLIARTDAFSAIGITEAIARAQAYRDHGADLVFVEAPSTLEALSRIAHALSPPLMLNVVEGGKTPNVSVSEADAMGFKVVLFANTALRLGVQAVIAGMTELLRSGQSPSGRLLPWADRQSLARLEVYEDLETRIRMAAAETPADQEDTTP